MLLRSKELPTSLSLESVKRYMVGKKVDVCGLGVTLDVCGLSVSLDISGLSVILYEGQGCKYACDSATGTTATATVGMLGIE